MAVGPNSRYTKSLNGYPSCHTYTANGDVILDDAKKPALTNRSTNYLFAGPPTGDAPPPLNYMTKETDSFDLLASTQYQDSQKWWVIADANPHIRYPLDLTTGDQINLPN
jgi:hypothetical protein